LANAKIVIEMCRVGMTTSEFRILKNRFHCWIRFY